MKQPKPERLVVTLGIPITVHSAAREKDKKLASDQFIYPLTHAEGAKAQVCLVIVMFIL